LSPYEFENFVGEVWSELGWETEVTKGAQDRGIDVVAQRDDKTELIQVKRYAIDNKVGSNEVRKYATLYQQESDADSIALVTASSFTRQAEELADDLDVRTIDGDYLYDYVKESGINKDILTEDSISNTTQGASSADEFVEIYGEFTELNKKLAKRVMMPASTAADYDGAEAAFARSGNREQLRFAIKMRNEWAEIINELENSITNMEGIPEKIPHTEFARLISEQIQTMYDLSEAYQRGLTYKDKLINSRFESAPIDPGGLREVKVPNTEILLKPEADVEDLKRSQDVAMTIAAKETGKIGEFSDERQRIIASVAERIN
jgi:predicted outer membrane protein